MIKPDRYTNLRFSVINISAYILKELNKFYSIKYDDLKKQIIDSLGTDAKINYPYALGFLYILDKIIYDEQSDSFKLK